MGKSQQPTSGHRKRLPGQDVAEFHACGRKKRYGSRPEAQKAAKRSSRKPDTPQLRVYQCEYCGGWHLTHRRPR